MRRFSVVAPLLGYLAATDVRRVTPDAARHGDAFSVERVLAGDALRRDLAGPVLNLPEPRPLAR